MSLWSMLVAAVTYADIEQFCATMQREGVNLDYKREIPKNDLAKLVAAFANTSGGMIVLGVDTDGNNLPIWPPAGMRDFSQFTERITQSCGASIYPPIQPSISPLIDNPVDPSTKLAIVRVEQSVEAPHAVDSGRRVYIRTGDVCDPVELADVNRIERLFESRRNGQKLRASILARHLKRFEIFAQQENPSAGVWWFISPYYPGAQLRALDECRSDQLWAIRRGPYGAWGLRQHSVRSERSQGDIRHVKNTEYVGIGVHGDFIRARWFFPHDKGTDCALSAVQLMQETRQFLQDAQSLYRHKLSSFPGLLQVTVGFMNLRSRRIIGFRHEIEDGEFPDPTFETEAVETFEEFVASDFELPTQPRIFVEITSEIAHAFDLPKPPAGL